MQSEQCPTPVCDHHATEQTPIHQPNAKSLKALFTVALLLLLSYWSTGISHAKDDMVIISYQHLANFSEWVLYTGVGTGHNKSNTDMWHVYMLRGIVNMGKDAKPFNFDIKKISTKDNSTVMSDGGLVMDKANYLTKLTLTLPYTRKIDAGQAFTIPYGQGILFFIMDTNDTEQTLQTTLKYNSVKGEKVLMNRLDTKSKVMYSLLDTAFLEKIHKEQNKYENNYTADGKYH